MTSTTDTQSALDAQVITWRRHLHQHPELSFQEHETADYVETQLREMNGLIITRPTPTSILAVLQGQAGPGRTVLLRADMDALPIQEETEYDFASQNDGVMHACGHDGHTAMLLGAAKVLSEQSRALHGEVRFIFQHAEELFPGGAQQVVDAGVMDGVDVAVGAHLFSPIPVGLVALKSGPLMAAPDTFELTVIGKGGHGAMPHETVDPIVIAAHIVTALQTIVSRQRDPLEPAVVSVTTFQSGTAHNIIPNSAVLTGTVRTFDASLREQIPRLMERLVQGLTDGFGASYQLNYTFGYRATVNDPEVTDVLRSVVRDTLGPDALIEAQPTMGGEDFSAYQTKAPGTFIFIGARNEQAGISAPHHHPKFAIDEQALSHGVKVLVEAALRLSQQTSGPS
ncbi:M20 family metallopeptidase [Deinococcus peraridilitoris]|uniref:Amidohydrolase n=1 Tax=Deinococcus peraridilitoris (strain DSM 19664 / LMG 22246 / CIP 109416 / KR-200) TaxID=937777 RepID=K9ZYI1_DEIPD|nr:M20 family metallopeptidase [Deinococcus peraridilitoris]AFZ66259.1 amidohydrolase [Deinococcus peraridilitoris DSM 19664]